MVESNIEKKLAKAAKRAGGMAIKLYCPNYVGMPDRIVLIAIGKVAFVEVKAPGEKPRKIQQKRRRELETLGFRVYVLDDEKEIGGIIDEIRTS